MSELNETEKKVLGMMIGGIALLIAFSFVWDNYQEYQQRERSRKSCENIKKHFTQLREDAVDPSKKGDNLTSSQVAAIYQLESLTNSVDCNQIK